jgi:hypothetical protein
METATKGHDDCPLQTDEWASGMPVVVRSIKLSSRASIAGRDMRKLKRKVPQATKKKTRMRQKTGGQKDRILRISLL